MGAIVQGTMSIWFSGTKIVIVSFKWTGYDIAFSEPLMVWFTDACMRQSASKGLTLTLKVPRYSARSRWSFWIIVWPAEMYAVSLIANENLMWWHHTWTLMRSSNGNIFRATGPLWGSTTVHWWIPLTKASDAELWFFICALTIGWANNRVVGDLRSHRAHYDVTLMTPAGPAMMQVQLRYICGSSAGPVTGDQWIPLTKSQ